jgi:Zn-dependent protease with chaperone function
MRSTSAAGWKSGCRIPVSEPAAFFDGRSAARRDVVIRFEVTGIRIDGDGVYEFWAYSDIRYAGAGPGDLPLAFHCQSSTHNDARLIVGDRTTIETLRIRCPDLADRARKSSLRRRGAAWSAVGIVALGLVVWSSIDFLPGVIVRLVPIAWEESVGDGVVDDIAGILGALTKSDAKRCARPAGRAALDRLVARLVAQAETPYRFQVIVLDIDMVNALAAPGGRIVVLGKLLEDAKTPDEVAGVIAHEIGHVIARHPTEAVARGMGMSLVFNVLLGGLGGGTPGAIGQTLVGSAYSRDAEREADAIALGILRGARISPAGLADFFERLAEMEGTASRALAFVSSHPPSEERSAAAREAASPSLKPALSNDEWGALKIICGEKSAG